MSRRTLRLVSGVRVEHASWASLEVLADRLLRFGPEQISPLVHEAPAPLRRIIHRALRSNPGTRSPSAAELHDDLRAYLHGLGRPFGRAEAAAELARILGAASALPRVDAHPIERGALPWPRATSPRTASERAPR